MESIDSWIRSSTLRFRVLLLCVAAIVGCTGSRDYLGRANKAFANRNFRQALLDYQKAIQKDPQLAEAFHGLGATQARLGNFVEAVTSLEKALRLEPDNDALRGELADAVLSLYLMDPRRPKARYDQVAKLSRELLAKDPQSFDGLRFQASLLYISGQVPEAIEIFRKANAVRPVAPDVILPLAEALRKNGQTHEAESLALELVRQHRDCLPIYDWLYSLYRDTNRSAQAEAILVTKAASNPQDSTSLMQLAAHYSEAKKPKEMAATLDQVLSRPQDFPDRFLLVSDFYLKIQNWDEAARWLESGIKNDHRQDLVYRKRLVSVYIHQQKHQAAIDLLKQLIQKAPNDWELRAERMELLLSGKDKQEIRKAIAEGRELVTANPQEARLKFLLGMAYLEDGEKESAAQAFAQAAAQQNLYVEPRVALADLARQTGNFNETVRLADEILAIDPHNFNGRLLHASGSRALGNLDAAQRELEALEKEVPHSHDVQQEMDLLLIARKQNAAARQMFHSLRRAGRPAAFHKHAPEPAASDPVFLNNRAYFIAEDGGDLDEALAYSEAALRKLPDNSAVLDTLAWIYTKRNRNEKAVAILDKLVRRNPEVAAFHFHLATALAQKGDTAQAKAELAVALTKAPTTEEEARIKELIERLQ